MAGRRGNGEGSDYQRSDGTWRGQALLAMTLDIYSAYIPSMGRDAADQLDDLLS